VQVAQEASLSAWDPNALFSPGDQDFWVRIIISADNLAGFGSNQHAVSRWSTNGREWILWYNNSNATFNFSVSSDGTATTATAQSGITPANNTEFHLFAYHDSVNNVIAISVNGETPVTSAHSAGLFQSPDLTDFMIAGHTTDVATWDGWLRSAMMGSSDAGMTGSFDTINSLLYNSGNPLSYDELFPDERRSMGLSDAFALQPDREGNDFTGEYSGVVLTSA
jgi:hypothetical protein